MRDFRVKPRWGLVWVFALMDRYAAVIGTWLDCVWNVMAHAQKPDFVFRVKRTSPFKSAGGRQFSRLLAAEVCVSAVVMLDTPCFEVAWRVLATHCIRQFPLHFPSRVSPYAITFQHTYNCTYSQKGRPTLLVKSCAVNVLYCEWRHHDVLENQLVLHKRTSAQSIYSRVKLHVSTRC